MSTRYPLQLQGFEGQSLEVRPSGLASGPKLLVNGQPATPGVRRGLMVLRRNDGREIVASLRPQVLGLDVPRLYVDGQLINMAAPPSRTSSNRAVAPWKRCTTPSVIPMFS